MDNPGETGAVIVTGAAGGMGAAIARIFANRKWPLVLSDLHSDPLESLAEELRRTTPTTAVDGDIADPSHIEAIMAALGDRPIATLAHAAGVSPTMAGGSRIFEINFTATQRLVETTLPKMAHGGTAVLGEADLGVLDPRIRIVGLPASPAGHSLNAST